MKKTNIKILIILIVIALGVAVLLFIQTNQKTPNAPLKVPEELKSSSVPTKSTSSVAKTETGFIEGVLSYPSDFIPSSMITCAENSNTGEQFCAKKQVDIDSYKIEVPAGNYYVFAYVPTPGKPIPTCCRAYYNEFVTCSLNIDYNKINASRPQYDPSVPVCNSHKPIEVVVSPGQTTSGIDPGDWYDLTYWH